VPEALELVVLGARRRCGGTTVARGLAAVLDVPGARPAHVIALDSSSGHEQERVGLGTGGSVWEVPVALRSAEEVAEYGATTARLAGRPAAIVWDVSCGGLERAETVAAAADAVVAVVPGSGEPALGELLGEMLAARFRRVLVVANRADAARWRSRACCLPESRLGALLAGRGRRPGGSFGAALSELAALL
jgi:hypothetical protein